MAYTYEQLHAMNVSQLREIARSVQHDSVKGFSTMHKEKLIPALCTALGIETHLHHHVVGDFNKGKVKQQIRQLKLQRTEALEKHDSALLADIHHQLHHLKHELRKHIL